ncbi:hypothetical protein Hdeb2414_s0009g00314191 [Helianthus debilis subsp. tardiflorus]
MVRVSRSDFQLRVLRVSFSQHEVRVSAFRSVRRFSRLIQRVNSVSESTRVRRVHSARVGSVGSSQPAGQQVWDGQQPWCGSVYEAGRVDSVKPSQLSQTRSAQSTFDDSATVLEYCRMHASEYRLGNDITKS